MDCQDQCKRGRCRGAIRDALLSDGKLMAKPRNGVTLLGFDDRSPHCTRKLCAAAARRIPNVLLAVDEVYDKICFIELEVPTNTLFGPLAPNE